MFSKVGEDDNYLSEPTYNNLDPLWARRHGFGPGGMIGMNGWMDKDLWVAWLTLIECCQLCERKLTNTRYTREGQGGAVHTLLQQISLNFFLRLSQTNWQYLPKYFTFFCWVNTINKFLEKYKKLCWYYLKDEKGVGPLWQLDSSLLWQFLSFRWPSGHWHLLWRVRSSNEVSSLKSLSPIFSSLLRSSDLVVVLLPHVQQSHDRRFQRRPALPTR